MARFEIYRSLNNGQHYVAILEGDETENAVGVRESENLEFAMNIPDDGAPRIAFDPEAAKTRIADHGFYAFAVTVELREHAD